MKVLKLKPSVISAIFAGLMIWVSGLTLAQEDPGECVEMGALAFDNWTTVDAGGSGNTPGGVQSPDYIRCKACHGWDRRGLDGGYVRRSRQESRPNAGAGDGDASSRAIVTGSVTENQVLHTGRGRSYAQGQGSWVELDDQASAANTAAHAGGYTLGNQHPDFSSGGLTQEQIGCLVEFLNFEDGDPDRYFSDINTSQDPVLYTVVESANLEVGEAFFEINCEDCHTLTSVLAYLEGDGKFSELAHKARWGVPDSDMTRKAMGNPDSDDIADLMLYLQDAGGTGFVMTPGLTGTWWNGLDRTGEGLLFEVGYSNGVLTIFVTFYTYDDEGKQTWLIAQGVVTDDMVDVDISITEGPVWGDAYNPDNLSVIPWGSGALIFSSCKSGALSLMPNEEMRGRGFTNLAYDIRRDLLDSGIACPTPAN
jgi:hypothetical protein